MKVLLTRTLWGFGPLQLNIDRQDKLGRSALMMAAQHGHEGILNILLASDAKVDLQGSGFEKIGSILIDSIFASWKGRTALMMVSSQGHERIVQALLGKDANVDLQRENDGATAMYIASEEGHEGIVKALVAKGANVDFQANRNLSMKIRHLFVEFSVVVTNLPGCVFGDLANPDPAAENPEETKCPSVTSGGWFDGNQTNEIYFNEWPSSPEYDNDLGLTRLRDNGTGYANEADVFISPFVRWIRNTGKEVYQCKLLKLEFYFFDEVLLHEVGHAIGLGHEFFTDYSLMTPSSDWTCVPQTAMKLVDGKWVVDYSGFNALIKPIDFLRVKTLYPQLIDHPITMDLYVQSPQEGQHLVFGQAYTFSVTPPQATSQNSSSIETANKSKDSRKIVASSYPS